MRRGGFALRIVRGQVHQHADAPHALALLRARRERPRPNGSHKPDEITPPHGPLVPNAPTERAAN
jgi:hypothetical protein